MPTLRITTSDRTTQSVPVKIYAIFIKDIYTYYQSNNPNSASNQLESNIGKIETIYGSKAFSSSKLRCQQFLPLEILHKQTKKNIFLQKASFPSQNFLQLNIR